MSDNIQKTDSAQSETESVVQESNPPNVPTPHDAHESSTDDSSIQSESPDSSSEEVLIHSPPPPRDTLLKITLGSFISHFGVPAVLTTVADMVDVRARRTGSSVEPTKTQRTAIQPVSDETSVPVSTKRVHWTPQESKNLWILWKNTDPNPCRRNNWKRILETGHMQSAFCADRNPGKLKDRLRWLQDNPHYGKEQDFPEDEKEDQ
ncbi:hypothetical protein P9112_009928 [Eukaryota sp. TZLM1-RC]